MISLLLVFLSQISLILGAPQTILCLIHTATPSHETRAKTILETWVQHCDDFLFFTDSKMNDSIPHIYYPLLNSRDHSWEKIRRVFKYVRDKITKKYDWYYRADDDTYALMHNMRTLLDNYSPTKHHYLGLQWNFFTPRGFNDGSSYILSRPTMEAFNEVMLDPDRCPDHHRAEEDQEGVCVGDRIVQVGTESMEGHDRLHAVELVRRCGQRVPMVIARLDGLIRHQKDVSAEMLASAGRKKSFTSSSGDLLNAPNRTNGQSRTPPAPRKAANRRQRAVSDFGAIGDALPTLDGDNLINIKAISGLHLDESDEEKGEYRLPTTSMYAFDRDDDLQASIKESKKPAPEPKSGELRKYRYARRSNLEIAEEIEEEAVESSDDDGQIDEGKRVIDVELDRNENGSLGVQIASLSGRVCIKQLTSEPAISHPDIRVGDVLLYVNGIAVEGKVHQEVVAMLRGGGDRVVLGVQRPPPAYSDQHHASSTSASAPLISVMLLKKPMATLGLSLAKRTMSDGIFIRNIAQDSAASSEGTLRVGDRLVSLDGEPVDGFTPATILEKLKLVQGPVQITVTREQTA